MSKELEEIKTLRGVKMGILLTKGNIEDVFKILDNYNINSALMLDNKLKALETKEKTYVIYCISNYRNIYMDYRGEPCNYHSATIFSNKFEAHKFLREKANNDYYRWSVFDVEELKQIDSSIKIIKEAAENE